MSLIFNLENIVSGTSQLTLGTQMCAARTEVKHTSFKLCRFIHQILPDIRGTSPLTFTENTSPFVLVSLLFWFDWPRETPVNVKIQNPWYDIDLAHFSPFLSTLCHGQDQALSTVLPSLCHEQDWSPACDPTSPPYMQQNPNFARFRELQQIFVTQSGFINRPFEKSFPRIQPTTRDRLYCTDTVKGHVL